MSCRCSSVLCANLWRLDLVLYALEMLEGYAPSVSENAGGIEDAGVAGVSAVYCFVCWRAVEGELSVLEVMRGGLHCIPSTADTS